MTDQAHTLLLLTGPVGVGKTSVADEVSTLLEADGVAHCFVDLDTLTYTYPRQPDDPFADELALENLAAVWTNARRRGARNLIVPRVCESPDYPHRIAAAVGMDAAIVCRLTASDDTLLCRVRHREIGSNRAWHEARALELARLLGEVALEDFCVATDDRAVTEVATDIVRRVPWTR